MTGRLTSARCSRLWSPWRRCSSNLLWHGSLNHCVHTIIRDCATTPHPLPGTRSAFSPPSQPAVYTLLEGRLSLCPIAPNDALRLLAPPLSLLEHPRVVEHLVSATQGNACCLNPSLCLRLMEQLLMDAPPPPIADVDDPLSSPRSVQEKELLSLAGTRAVRYGVAARVALAPLRETLMTCLMVDLRWRLGSAGNAPAPLWRLSSPATAAVPPSDVDGGAQDGDGGNDEGERCNASQPQLVLLRGAAVLLAFAAEHTAMRRWRARTPAQRAVDGTGVPLAVVRVLCAVVDQLMQRGSADQESPVEALLAERGDSRSPRRRPWVELHDAVHECWWWSLLLCQAVPLLPLREARAFVVASQIASLRKLHGALAAISPETASSSVVVASARRSATMVEALTRLEVLEWVLLRAFPIVNAPQDPLLWTTVLRNAWLALAESFTDLAVRTLDGSAKSVQLAGGADDAVQSWLVRSMAGVAFRLALQSAAAAPLSAADGSVALSAGMGLAAQLMRSVSAVTLRVECADLLRHAGHDACGDARSRSGDAGAADVGGDVVVSEETYCRLASVAQLLLSAQRWRGDVAGSLESDSPLVDVDASSGWAGEGLIGWLLHAGVRYMARTHADASKSDKDGPLQHYSLQFLLTVVKCWRSWLLHRSGATARASQCSRLPIASALGPAETREGEATAARQKADELRAGASWDTDSQPAHRNAEEQCCSYTRASTRPAFCPHQLSLWLTEAWAAALDVRRDASPLDICTCWASLRTGCDAAHSGAAEPLAGQSGDTDADARACGHLATCARCLAQQCADFLVTLRAHKPSAADTRALQMFEGRPRVACSSATKATHGGPDLADDGAVWVPASTPAWVSTAALLALHPDHQPLTVEGDAADECVAGPQTPMGEKALSVLQRHVDPDLNRELVYFQHCIVSGFVRWCGAARVNVGWCRTGARDCCAGGEPASPAATHCADAPWFMLAVHGIPCTAGARGGADVAALTYLWSLGAGARARQAVGLAADLAVMAESRTCWHGEDVAWLQYDALRVAQEAADASASAASPFTLCSANVPLCSAPTVNVHLWHQQPWLRRGIGAWTRCYALRLLLFLLEGDALHREKAAWARRQSQSAVASLAGGWRWQGPQAAPPSVPPRKSDGSAAPLCRERAPCDVLSRAFLWRSEALQPHLCAAARGALEASEKLCVTLTATSTMEALPRGDAASLGAAQQIVLQLLTAGAVDRARRSAQASLAMCTQQLLRGTVGEADTVTHLEERLGTLGFVHSTPPAVCCGGSTGGSPDTVVADGAEGEEWAVLTMLSLAPHLSFLPSPSIRAFAEALWASCWMRCVRRSQDSRKQPPSGAVESPLNFRRCAAVHCGVVSEAAELDALVTCRAMLLAAQHLHRFADQVVAYLCTVYVPSVLSCRDALLLHLAPSVTEALESQLAERDSRPDRRSSLLADPTNGFPSAGGGGCGFHFSPEALRAYEVLCRDRFGPEERRPPCVWERWVREVASSDAVLRQHPVLQWRSSLVSP